MRFAILCLFIALTVTGRVVGQDSISWIKINHAFFDLRYSKSDSSVTQAIGSDLEKGRRVIAGYFGSEFQDHFTVYIFPNRVELDKEWRKDWHSPEFNSECWMVASGVGDRLDILSPLDWTKDACDHRVNDSAELQQIIVHELVHVFHGQRNPTRTFDGMDDLSWFVEGLATFVSGQLTNERVARVRSNLKEGKAPARLSQLWTGKDKYGQAGSFIGFLEKKFGRETIIRLLPYTDLASILAFLKTDETSLLSEWKKNMLE